MRDLKTLILQPKQYFENFTEGEYEEKQPLRLRYLFLTFILISILNLVVNNYILGDSFQELGMGEEYIAEKYFVLLEYAIGVGGVLIYALICVNILYFVSGIFMKFIENETIKDKKFFKSLLYVRYIIFNIVSLILSLIVTIVLRDIDLQQTIALVNNIFIKMWATYFLYSIFKYYLQTNKLHKILPTILYIFTLIFSIGGIVSSIYLNYL